MRYFKLQIVDSKNNEFEFYIDKNLSEEMIGFTESLKNRKNLNQKINRMKKRTRRPKKYEKKESIYLDLSKILEQNPSKKY